MKKKVIPEPSWCRPLAHRLGRWISALDLQSVYLHAPHIIVTALATLSLHADHAKHAEQNSTPNPTQTLRFPRLPAAGLGFDVLHVRRMARCFLRVVPSLREANCNPRQSQTIAVFTGQGQTSESKTTECDRKR